MWDHFFLLLAMCTVMGLASFLAGLLPLSFALSQDHSHIISLVGTGLLVGTCLIIIIPEGIETLYDARADSIHGGHAQQTASGGTDDQTTVEYDPHAWIGVCLVLGFIVMYLIDQLPKVAANLVAPKKPMHISLANLSQGLHRAPSPTRMEDTESIDEQSQSPPLSQSSATTIGLVIHAAADGIALAASSFLNQTSTGIVVFLALMVHKAPAAFGLTSVLLNQGYSKRLARAHLMIFSLAAPVGALFTWALVSLLSGGQISHEHATKFATGLLLLFSGGTFLYVAMHTMQETGATNSGEGTGSNGFMDTNVYNTPRSSKAKEYAPALRDTSLIVVGMLLPLLAQVGHAH